MELISFSKRVSQPRRKRVDYPHEEFHVWEQNDSYVETLGRLTKVSTYEKLKVAGLELSESFCADDFSIVALQRSGVNPSQVPPYFHATPEQLSSLLDRGVISLNDLKESLVTPRVTPQEPLQVNSQELLQVTPQSE